MVKIIKYNDSNFSGALEKIIKSKRVGSEDVKLSVSRILEDIKKNKDPATGKPLDGIPFHPYYTVKDIFGLVVFLIIFAAIVFFAPEMGGYFLEHNNFIPADPLKTPAHIAPVWSFTPF